MSFGAPSEHITDERTILAVGLARAAAVNPAEIHPDAWKELSASFTEQELMELCFCIGWYIGIHTFAVLMDIEPPQPGHGPRDDAQ